MKSVVFFIMPYACLGKEDSFMKRIPSVAVGSIICFGTALALVGCEARTPLAATPTDTPAVSATAVQKPAGNPPSPQSAVANNAESAAPSPEKSTVNNSLVQPAGMTDGSKKEPATGANKKSFDSYTSQKPVLMGVALADDPGKVEKLHGKPKDQFVMDDESGSLTVYDYEGFAVGFNAKSQVEFVDVTSPDVDPGLNGFKLGQTVDEAVHALGKADSSTEYVLSFKTKTTVLKLDVDPKTKTVQSIKLFARSE